MNRKITDAGVGGLDLQQGRDDLLEELLATSPVESTEATSLPRRRRVLPVLAAAAAVVGVLAGTAWLGQKSPAPPATSPPVAASPDHGNGDRAVLSMPGWRIEYADRLGTSGGITYANDNDRFEITWQSGGQPDHDFLVADRNDIGTPTEVDLLGLTSLMWAYADRDHTVVRPVEHGVTLEVRGTGMSRAVFVDLLDRLRLVDSVALAEHVRATERVSREDRRYQDPPVPVLITAPGWTPSVDRDGGVAWVGPAGARLAQVWVSGVDDPFTYDRYLTADREETQLLGTRTLLADWREGAERFRVAATSPLVGSTILVLETSGMTRDGFLAVVRSAQVVPAADCEQVIRAAIG